MIQATAEKKGKNIVTLRDSINKKKLTEVLCKKRCSYKFRKIHRKIPMCQSLRPATLLRKRLWHRCFPVNFTKFIRTPVLTEDLQTTVSVNMNKFCTKVVRNLK